MLANVRSTTEGHSSTNHNKIHRIPNPNVHVPKCQARIQVRLYSSMVLKERMLHVELVDDVVVVEAEGIRTFHYYQQLLFAEVQDTITI